MWNALHAVGSVIACKCSIEMVFS